MQWTKLRLMLLCGTLSLASCTGTRGVVEDFCVLYRPVITKKGDAGPLTKLPWDQKAIILGNEQIYHQSCK